MGVVQFRRRDKQINNVQYTHGIKFRFYGGIIGAPHHFPLSTYNNQRIFQV